MSKKDSERSRHTSGADKGECELSKQVLPKSHKTAGTKIEQCNQINTTPPSIIVNAESVSSTSSGEAVYETTPRKPKYESKMYGGEEDDDHNDVVGKRLVILVGRISVRYRCRI